MANVVSPLVRSKLIAALKHASVTLIIAVISFMLVFEVWYPGALSQLMPGTKLFLLVMSVELVLGPCMSLVVFNPSKSLKELIIDYAIIIFIQISAFFYGLFSVIQSRPVYLVFVKDRIEIVSAVEITQKDAQEAEEKKFEYTPWSGPVFVCVRPLLDIAEKKRLLFNEIPSGKDVQYLPRFYRDCQPGFVAEHANSFDSLEKIIKAKGATQGFNDGLSKYNKLKWLPIIGKGSVWIAFVEPNTIYPTGYLNLDPFDVKPEMP